MLDFYIDPKETLYVNTISLQIISEDEYGIDGAMLINLI